MSIVHPIPSDVHPGVCGKCRRQRTLCADVVLRGRPCVMCSACRVTCEGKFTVASEPLVTEFGYQEGDSRARRLGRGLKARSPSKHRMPFTF